MKPAIATATIKRSPAKNLVHVRTVAVGNFEDADVLLAAKSAGITRSVPASASTANVIPTCADPVVPTKSWILQTGTEMISRKASVLMFTSNEAYQNVLCLVNQT